MLKDGVAASIYGSRSANGVIIVTTKNGAEGKTKLSYRGSFKFETKPNLDDLHMASTSDYIDAEEVGGNWTRSNSIYKQIATANSYRMRLAYNDGTSLSNPSNHYVPDGDMINVTRYSNENWTVRTQVNFNRTFSKHRVTALAGNEVRRITAAYFQSLPIDNAIIEYNPQWGLQTNTTEYAPYSAW